MSNRASCFVYSAATLRIIIIVQFIILKEFILPLQSFITLNYFAFVLAE